MKNKILLYIFLIFISSYAYTNEQLIGLYFNDIYIQELNVSQNHISAMRGQSMDGPQAIKIFEKDNDLILLELWNFHEGVSIKINRNKSQLIKTDRHDYTVENNKLHDNSDNEGFTKISDKTESSEFESYILQRLFPEKNYESDIGDIIQERNYLNINGLKYILHLDVAGYINSSKMNILANEDGKKYAFDVNNNQFYEMQYNEIILERANDTIHLYNKKTIDLSGYEIIDTDFSIQDSRIQIAYILNEQRFNNISPDKINLSVVNNLLVLSENNSEVYLHIDSDIIFAGNNRIIDISGTNYEYLDFYGWQVSITPDQNSELPIVRIDPITDNGNGITDGFTAKYDNDYKQYVYEVFPSGGIPGIVIDLDEPRFISIARSGITNLSMEFGYSNLRKYINSLTKQEIRIFRNTLFALQGYKFNSQDLFEYFLNFNWYEPDPNISNSKSILSIEQQRLFDIILEVETTK